MDSAADDNAEEDLYDVAEEGVAPNLPPAVRFAPWDAQDADAGLGSSSPCGSQGADRGSLSSGDSLPHSRLPPSKAAYAARHQAGVSLDLPGTTCSPDT